MGLFEICMIILVSFIGVFILVNRICECFENCSKQKWIATAYKDTVKTGGNDEKERYKKA